jgi:hypothetical protein
MRKLERMETAARLPLFSAAITVPFFPRTTEVLKVIPLTFFFPLPNAAADNKICKTV